MSIPSDGNSYGIPDGIIYSFPVTVSNGKATIVDGLECSDDIKTRMKVSADELITERSAVEDLL